MKLAVHRTKHENECHYSTSWQAVSIDDQHSSAKVSYEPWNSRATSIAV